MSDVTESQYKFNLSLDMIYFLMYLLIKNRPDKIEMISQIVDKWNSRVKDKLTQMSVKESQKYAEEYGIDPDVASIILSAHQVEPKMLQKEFADHIKQLMINTFLQEEKPKE